MSGLFWNFFKVNFNVESINIKYIPYNGYTSKVEFNRLKEDNPDVSFYRKENRIYFWPKRANIATISGEKTVSVTLKQHPALFARVLEDALVQQFERLQKYNIRLNKYSHTWDFISKKDELQGKIQGLEVNKVVTFSTTFYFKDDCLLFGFSLSCSLKNKFLWNRQDFLNNGVDIKGLKSDGEKIFANKQSLKRFLESRGQQNIYSDIVLPLQSKQVCFATIFRTFQWLNEHKKEVVLPDGLSISTLTMQYLPLENNILQSELLQRPKRYFYANQTNIKKLKFYDEMIKEYKPYSLELFDNEQIKVGVICPKDYVGETEIFCKKLEGKLREIFHLSNNIDFCIVETSGNKVEDYKDILYEDKLLKSQLVYVVVRSQDEKLQECDSPYYVCKAKLISNGIPTQDIKIETIRQKLDNPSVIANISLNTYAKIGGTAWTIEKEDKLKYEFVVGIGTTTDNEGKHVIGIAQIFQNDGHYIVADCTPISTFDNYAENLERHLFKTLSSLLSQVDKHQTCRIIFHLFKSASEKYEIKAVHNLVTKFSDYNFEYALLHLGYGHNHRLYYNDGKMDVLNGTFIQLDSKTALLNFVNKSDLPLKIDLDKRSTFTSLFYLSKQIFWFSHLSHRSYSPAKRAVTIMYPSLMASMIEKLKKVEGWDYERLQHISDKLWFI